jgi:hypothetical protein
MSYVVRPISDRTAFTGKHERSRFATTWSITERQLLSEVRHLRGRDLVLELDVLEGAIRLDGKLYANAEVASPGVRIAFESMHGPLTYATDRFTTWQDNVRAIALGLEALRKVDRYGITRHGEQYTGWKALPSGSGTSASHMTRDDALAVLWQYGRTQDDAGATTGLPGSTDPVALARYFRRARAAAHPDRHDGARTLWDQVEQAAAVLGVTS